MDAGRDACAFRLERLDGSVGLVTFDQPGRKVNTLSSAVLAELLQLVQTLEPRTDLNGLLFRSGKPGQFIAGADLKELAALGHAPASEVEALIDLGQSAFSALGGLPFPTVALIDGPCLGGGTELVLALDDRILSDNPRTALGLPEVRVGMIPAWGGTQRLPRLATLSLALDAILDSQPIDPPRALATGVASAIVPASELLDAGRAALATLRGSGTWTRNRRRRAGPLPDLAQAAELLAEAERRLNSAGHPPDPAQRLALEALQRGIHLPIADALAAETAVARRIIGSPHASKRIAEFFDRGRTPSGPNPSEAG